MADAGATVGWRVFGGVAGIAGAMLARKAATTGWKLATGKEPPDTPESPNISWAEAVGWAAVSGTIVALARLAATRSAASTWARSTGSLPPGFEADVQA